MKSWQTTIAGIVAVLCGAVLIGIKFNRGESLTEIEWATIGGLLAAGYGLFKARDNNKTSEQVKAGRTRTDFVRPKLVALCLLPMLTLTGGCAQFAGTTMTGNVNETRANSSEGLTYATSGSAAYMDGSKITAAYQALTPTLFKQDVEGAWGSTGGVGGMTTMTFPTGETLEITDPKTGELVKIPLVVALHLWSPNDSSVGKMQIEFPNGNKLTIEDVQANTSPVVEALTPGILKALEVTQGLAPEQAKIRVQELVAKGEISQAAADAFTALVEKVPSILGAM